MWFVEPTNLYNQVPFEHLVILRITKPFDWLAVGGFLTNYSRVY
jgi:hypothetical protein